MDKPKKLNPADVRRATPVRMLGVDARIPANDEPDAAEGVTEAERLEIDRGFLFARKADPFRQADADRAMRAEINRAPGHWR